MSIVRNILKLSVFLLVLGLSFYLINFQDKSALSGQSVPIKLLLAVISGVFYTSLLTAPLSIALFVVLATTTNVYLVTLFGGIGAVLGDLLIVKFFRTIFASFSFLTHRHIFKGLKSIFRAMRLDLISIVVGLIIVASPFPDELGLILLGASSLSYFKLTAITFVLNTLGILILLLVSKALI